MAERVSAGDYRVTIMAAITLFLNPKHRKALFSALPKRSFWISALAGTLLAFHLNGWALSLVYTDAFAASTILGTYVLADSDFFCLASQRKDLQRSADQG